MLPVFFIAAAIATAGVGVTKDIQAYNHQANAKTINQYANDQMKEARDQLNLKRAEVKESLANLGQEKIFILNNSIHAFLDTFTKIKNVDFADSLGLDEIKNLKIDQTSFKELKELSNLVLNVVGGAAAGTAGGALTAFGAWSAAQTFAAASTGTAISSLSGAASMNATLAFFGGGSLAAGGGGMALGTAVLGGLVAGPALMVMGFIVDNKAGKSLENALKNKAESDKIVASLNTASDQCIAIRRRSYMFYELLARLDAYFLPLIWKMENIFQIEGDDYRHYRPVSKKIVAEAAALACSIKAVLDTPILSKEGQLTEASEKITNIINPVIYKDAEDALNA